MGIWRRFGHQVRGPVGPSGLECETERIVVEDAELARSQWRPDNVSAQSLEARSVIGLDTGRRMQGESTHLGEMRNPSEATMATTTAPRTNQGIRRNRIGRSGIG